MPDISDKLMATKFKDALDSCVYHFNDLTCGEQRFIDQMQESLESSSASSNGLGFVMPKWNPTVRQWNWLMEIAGRLS